MSGIVLDIQRCSLHDGPGVRTTVFLKGCPLRCRWCHNPESQAAQPVLLWNQARCTTCSACVAACPHGCHQVVDGVHRLDRDACTACGACVAACPEDALEVKGRRMAVAEVMAVVERDRAYYQRSGGGLTISGGEPLAQACFSAALLTAARAAGIHTCVESSGAMAVDRYRELLPLVDHWLIDCKGGDEARHREHTGLGNATILANLALLHDAGAQVTVRCPLVPGLNDGDDDLRFIAGLRRRLPRLAGIEIMPYHAMGNAKARRAGLAVALEQPDATAADRQRWRQRLAEFGEAEVLVPA